MKRHSWPVLVVVLLIAFGFLSGLVIQQSELNAVDVLEDAMLAGGERLGHSLLPLLPVGSSESQAAIVSQLDVASNSLSSRIRILSGSGQVLADSGEGLPLDSDLLVRAEVVAALKGQYHPYVGLGRDPSPGLFVAVPIVRKGRVDLIVYLSHPTANLFSELQPIRWFAIKGLLGLSLMVVLWAAWITGRLGALYAQILRINQKVLERAPVPVLEGQVVAPLAESYNHLLEELQEKVALLEAEKQRNKRFLQDLAHYLKTPLTGMAGSIEAVQGVHLPDPALNRLLQRVGSETGRLSRLVSQLLALEKVGYSNLQLEPFELGSLLEVTMGHFESAATSRNIQLRWEAESLAVLGDVEQVRAVLQNLLDNAVRCSPDGGEVCVRCYERDDLARVEVQDRGPGVSPEEREAVFERFSGGRASGGSMGLGLAIAREVMNAHGQVVGVESREGGGCCFFFTLALAGPT